MCADKNYSGLTLTDGNSVYRQIQYYRTAPASRYHGQYIPGFGVVDMPEKRLYSAVVTSMLVFNGSTGFAKQITMRHIDIEEEYLQKLKVFSNARQLTLF